MKMKEELIKFDTAKLAKEKGFDLDLEDILYFYTKPRSKMFGIDEHFRSYLIKNTPKKLYKVGEHACLNIGSLIPAPTQALLQKWLREEHKLHIVIIPTLGGFTFKVVDVQMDPSDEIERPPYKEVDGRDFTVYEEALEGGLREMLGLLEHNK